MLTIYNDGTEKSNDNRNICVAFTCENVDDEFEKIKKLGVEIIEEPKLRPYGTKNMSFYDPDGNIVYLRSILK